MTPRDAMIRALRREPTEGLVPHLELEYQLTEVQFGQAAIGGHALEGLTGAARDDLLKRNAELWIRVAERFRWNVMTGPHWLPLDDQCRTLEIIRELSGDTYMLSASMDPTFAIPSGTDMMQHVLDLAERADEIKEECHQDVLRHLEWARALRDAGAEVVFLYSDYCFNDGPFLSPPMFHEFVTPFLAEMVDGLHDLGMWAVKHTDGDIMPILEEMISAGIDGLHSLDPMAGVDIRRVAEVAGDRICLIGNVDCRYLQEGQSEPIRESTLYALEHGGVDRGGFVLASSNCIFAGVPQSSYDTMLAVREEYGYPGARRPVEHIGPPRAVNAR
jgi:uroporphyrinogen decarboxylase